MLDLVEMSTKKFLSPDMTLLVESKHGSALSEMTSLMQRFIQHEDWEVRDSALSLLLACTDIAFVSKCIGEFGDYVLYAEYALGTLHS